MTIERYLIAIAGIFVFTTVLLAHFRSRYWLIFTGFVGLNLLQSAFTNWSPLMTILKRIGVENRKRESEAVK